MRASELRVEPVFLSQIFFQSLKKRIAVSNVYSIFNFASFWDVESS